jgi:hypothetical protein
MEQVVEQVVEQSPSLSGATRAAVAS